MEWMGKMERIRSLLQRAGERELFFAALFLIIPACLLFFFAVHRPLSEARAVTLEERDAAEHAMTEVANFKNAHLDEKAYEAQLVEQDARSAAALPDSFEQAAFLASLQREALASRVTLLGIVPQEPVQRDGYAALPITVRVQADFFSLLDFLQQIEEGDRFLRVDALEAVSEKGMIKCTMQISIYAANAAHATDPSSEEGDTGT